MARTRSHWKLYTNGASCPGTTYTVKIMADGVEDIPEINSPKHKLSPLRLLVQDELADTISLDVRK